MPTIPKELIVFFASMLPIGELRAGIPLGLFWGMSKESTFFWAQLGNIVIVMAILKILGPISSWLMKHSKWCEKNFNKLFHHTRTKHQKKIEKMGGFFLILITSIPVIGTGGWTAALIAFLFGLPYWQSVGFILIGNIICGILVILGFGGAMEFIKFFIK